MKPILFNNTVLRDGHQSLAATRMTTAQMLPAAKILDGMGFAGLETWGGATIDACLRFLGENPFDRLRALKQAAPRTPQIMLLRGQNIVQYTSFPDDVVEAFVRANAAAGQDIFRIFDALNDTRNLVTAIKTVKACGKHARGEICYTTSPVHTIDAFVRMGRELRELGCDSIGIKDMSGVIAPRVAAEMVTQLRAKVGLPITLHTHDTAGLGAAAYMAAIDAGVDAVETSITPFANGTAQPDTVRMIALLENHPRRPDFDTAKLHQLRQYFTGVYQELGKFTSTDNERVDSDTLCYQVPGGMLSNFRNQLKEQGMSDKFDQVMLEIPFVRASLGWIPLVTPTSQIVGTQAMMNVKFGRWKTIVPAAADIALNKYGRPPGRVSPELLKLIAERTGQQPIEGRPADALAPRMAKLRAELAEKKLPTNDEACVLHAMFPQEFAKLHAPAPAPTPAPAAPVTLSAPAATPAAPAASPRPGALAAGPNHFFITIGSDRHEVRVEDVSV
ncbi:Methylmalonyl-CoA carboxyltransferase 5S subunit [Lacunisphaera limnophila]|uniref:Methylmalonyl-CoA carboxyltransferase 5S subunit n=1 Tax=Lacunisphaera limnophila TaxID=1838286 RepID=A0A1D8AVE9_9BACT|nr:pyruvate carboxylase subunit B [Lacunisphaera limnophila]AOS44862.1 Methylmalonyl-CoA carboxyltransferase 5S subunit [Lacunisphaera limnophila]